MEIDLDESKVPLATVTYNPWTQGTKERLRGIRAVRTCTGQPGKRPNI